MFNPFSLEKRKKELAENTAVDFVASSISENSQAGKTEKQVSGERDFDTAGMLSARTPTDTKIQTNQPSAAVKPNLAGEGSFTNPKSQDNIVPENNLKPRAQVNTIFSAIAESAGEKEKARWEKRLAQERKKIMSEKKALDPNSPEAVLSKQFKEDDKAFAKSETVQKQIQDLANRSEPKAEVITKKVGTIRTFKSDLQSLMQKEKLSLTKIVAIESDKRRYHKEAKEIKKENKYSYIAWLILFLALMTSLSLLAYAYYLQKQDNTQGSQIDDLATAEISLADALIFIEDRIRIDVSEKSRIYILRILQAARDSTKISATLGNVIEFELLKKYKNQYQRLNSKEFLKILNPNASPVFLDAIGSKYITGVHVLDSGRQPFVIFTSNSYQYTFSEMLKWEKSIEKDAGIFLDPKFKSAYANNFEINASFKDATLKNYSVRVLYDKDAKVRLLYGFMGQDTLIITSNPRTFLELAARVAVEKGQ